MQHVGWKMLDVKKLPKNWVIVLDDQATKTSVWPVNMKIKGISTVLRLKWKIVKRDDKKTTCWKNR